MECKRNKLDCEEGGCNGCLQKGRVSIACLDGDKIERKWRIIMVWSNGITGVQEMERAKEGVAVLLNDMWHSAVIDFGCVSSRILMIKFKF